MVDAFDIGAGIIIIGLIIGLPNLDSFLIDFTQFGSTSINIIRLGLTAVFVYLMTGGRKNGR